MKNYTVVPFDTQNDGLLIIGYLYQPEGEGPFDCVIICHGFYDNLNNNTDIAEALAEQGMVVLNFDFCGGSLLSQSDGKVTENSVLTEIKDLEAVLAKAKSLPNIKNVFLLGISQGGFVSAIAAKKEENDVDKLALLNPAFIIPDDTRQRFSSINSIPENYTIFGNPVGKKYSEDVYNMDAFKEIEGYSNPTLIVYGEQDSVVPNEYIKKAAELYPNCDLVPVSNEGHVFSNQARQSTIQTIIDFYKK